MKCAFIFGSSNQALVITVFTSPGARALMRIPVLACSTAAALDNPMTPCLAAIYALIPGSAIRPASGRVIVTGPASRSKTAAE